MKHQERLQVDAVVSRKQEIPWVDIASGRGIPETKHFFEIVFQLDDKTEVICNVSDFEFHAVSVGDKGILTYIPHKHYNEVFSFSDKLIEFHM